MLRRIHIKNFRSCKDVVIDNLGNMTALVGRNGSGKTNILRAIELLARAAASVDLTKSRGLRPFSTPTEMSVDVECGDTTYRYSFGTKIVGEVPKHSIIPQRLFLQESLAVRRPKEKWETILNRQDEDVHVSGRSEPIKIGSVASSLPALVALLPDAEDLLKHIRSLLSFLAGVRYYPIDEPNEVSGIDSLVRADDYQEWVSRYQATGDADPSVVLRLLYAYHEHKDRFDELRSLLGPQGLGLLDDIEIESIGLPHGQAAKDQGEKGPWLYVVRFRPGQQLGSGRQALDYGALSVGTRRVLNILVSLVLDDSTLMLIEHPEDGIHRGLVRKLTGLLRANVDPGQIILSSHSGAVLNSMAAGDIRLVSIQRGATKVRALTPKEIAIATRYIDEEGTLAEFLETVEE